MPRGSLRAFCYCHKMGGNVAGCQHPKRAFLTIPGEVNNKIFLLINTKPTLFLCYGVILGYWKVPKRVQKLYTILLVILTKPYFTRVFWNFSTLKMRHVTHHVTVTFASRSLWTPVRVSFSSLYSFILLVF